MKRIKVVGLCIVAAFALSAVAASSASAGENGQCEAHKKGEYTEGNCITKSAKAHKGAWEWVPGPSPTCVAKKKGEYTNNTCTTKSVKAHKGTFEKNCPNNCAAYKDSTGKAELHTPALGAAGVECTASTSVGEITGVKTDVDLVTFTNCSTLGEKCTSEGEPEGTIKTFPIETILIDHGEKGPSGDEPKAGEVWTEFVGKPEFGGYSAIFGCTAVGFFATKGSLSGITTPTNVMSATSSTAFAGLAGEGGPGIGEQDLITEYNEKPEFPSGIGPFPSSEEVENAKTTNEEASEIKGGGANPVVTVAPNGVVPLGKIAVGAANKKTTTFTFTVADKSAPWKPTKDSLDVGEPDFFTGTATDGCKTKVWNENQSCTATITIEATKAGGPDTHASLYIGPQGTSALVSYES